MSTSRIPTTRSRAKTPAEEQPILRAMYNASEAARYLCVSRNWLYRWIQQGRLSGFKVGTRVRMFTRAELDAFAAELEAEGRAS